MKDSFTHPSTLIKKIRWLYSLVVALLFLTNTTMANCTFTGTIYASANPFASCSGTITIQGIFYMDQDYDVSGLGAVTIVLDGTLGAGKGVIDYTGNFDL